VGQPDLPITLVGVSTDLALTPNVRAGALPAATQHAGVPAHGAQASSPRLKGPREVAPTSWRSHLPMGPVRWGKIRHEMPDTTVVDKNRV
jgi:hypothetical protein